MYLIIRAGTPPGGKDGVVGPEARATAVRGQHPGKSGPRPPSVGPQGAGTTALLPKPMSVLSPFPVPQPLM